MFHENLLFTHIKELGGWIVAGVIILYALIKYGSTWFKVFFETGDSKTATLIAGLQRQVEHQEEVIEHMADRLRTAEKHYRDCEHKNIKLTREVAKLKQKLVVVGDEFNKIKNGSYE